MVTDNNETDDNESDDDESDDDESDDLLWQVQLHVFYHTKLLFVSIMVSKHYVHYILYINIKKNIYNA